jgi:hypothetical protein
MVNAVAKQTRKREVAAGRQVISAENVRFWKAGVESLYISFPHGGENGSQVPLK